MTAERVPSAASLSHLLFSASSGSLLGKRWEERICEPYFISARFISYTHNLIKATGHPCPNIPACFGVCLFNDLGHFVIINAAKAAEVWRSISFVSM